MTNLTPELIAKAKAAQSAEELFDLAKGHGIELTEEDAKTYFEQISVRGIVSDDDLETVAGGSEGGCGNDSDPTESYHTSVTLPENTFVEVIDGSCCPQCKGVKGVVKSTKQYMNQIGWGGNYISVYCCDCNKVILKSTTTSNVKIL